MTNIPNLNNCNTINRGRPKLHQEAIIVAIRFRRGRSQAEDELIDRLKQLPALRGRSRYIRRVLTTGELDAVLDRELAHETARVASALDTMGDSWDEDD
jgi:hypothetical protein